MQGILARRPVKVGLVLALLAILGWSVSPAIFTAEATPCDSELRHKIRLIHHRPGKLTNQELRHIQNLKDRIHDTDCNATTETDATTEKPSDNQYKPRNLLNDNGDDGGGEQGQGQGGEQGQGQGGEQGQGQGGEQGQGQGGT